MKTFSIEVGKRYKLRNGLVTGPIRKSSGTGAYVFEAEVMEPQHETPSVMYWTKDGLFCSTMKHRTDITEELKAQTP